MERSPEGQELKDGGRYVHPRQTTALEESKEIMLAGWLGSGAPSLVNSSLKFSSGILHCQCIFIGFIVPPGLPVGLLGVCEGDGVCGSTVSDGIALASRTAFLCSGVRILAAEPTARINAIRLSPRNLSIARTLD